MVDKFNVTRRTALYLIGSGTVVAASNGLETFGFSNITAMRGTSVETADDIDALIGLYVADTVTKNNRELLVEVTNNVTDDIDVTVSLEDGTQGTLYGPNGSGNSVTFSLAAATTDSTDSEIVEIEADTSAKDEIIPFTITAAGQSSGFSFEGTRETQESSNSTETGVVISTLRNFKANSNKNNWTIKRVVVDSDEFELDRVEYEISNENGTVVGSRVDSASGFTYDRSDLLIEPDEGYEVVKKTQYTLTVRAYDVEGNYDIRTATDEG